MIRIYIRKPGERTGRVYKSKSSILNDRVRMLPWSFVLKGVIGEDEWAKSGERLIDRFKLYVKETRCDGRTKRVRNNYKYFSWSQVLL